MASPRFCLSALIILSLAACAGGNAPPSPGSGGPAPLPSGVDLVNEALAGYRLEADPTVELVRSEEQPL